MFHFLGLENRIITMFAMVSMVSLKYLCMTCK